ncbi:Biopolymer transport protein ExbD/TolR [Polystyrenella longa]|uniref:Biopolymer transport protein ExbD/TolR n=2 Tax=Polystyrenella longa TaxID=2528007 RepID=A0A518CRY2_9PLAN|nr:Biopolymer transport protein ExbD/TolR [Polystyrenella longa]
MGGSEKALLAKKKKPEDADLDITPMIDVTFLLLIFFMVTSTMQESSNISPPGARHGDGTNKGDSVIITIAAPDTPTDEPEIRFGDKPNSPIINLGQVEAEVKTAVAALGIKEPNVIIKADRDTPHGYVQQVLREIDHIENVRYHIGVEDKSRSSN